MSQGRNILVVEDEPLIAMMLEDFLETLGHNVHASCDNLADGLSHADDAELDVAILDVNLKGEAVWSLAERLRARGLPFVIATGGHVQAPPAEFEDVPVLHKPYTIDRITPILEQALG